MTRHLDDDPYGDVIWGILTGYEAADALHIARRKEPLIVRRGVGGCGSLNLGAFDEGIKFNEGVKGGRWIKRNGGEEKKEDFPADSTKGLVDGFNEFKPDLFMTSGHATTRDWQIGYNYKDGQFRCEHGQLFGLDTKGNRYDINSPNPKVFLPVGNCLIGHIPTRDCMALALMHTGGVYQMFGYTAVTFHGCMGWGTGNVFIGQRDRYTLAQAFYANNQALVHRLETEFPDIARINFERYDNSAPGWLAQKHGLKSKDEVGFLWDRDCVAFYGDPAWEVRFRPTNPAWSVELTGPAANRQAERAKGSPTPGGRPEAS